MTSNAKRLVAEASRLAYDDTTATDRREKPVRRDIIAEAAADLWAAERERNPIGPLTQTYPGLNISTAYAIQQLNLRRRLAMGAALVGRKVGLTSRAMRTLFGVDEPDFGYIVDNMVFPNAASVPIARFCAPRVEPEVAFLLDKPLHGPDVTVTDVYAATAAVAASLEILDSRIADWKLTLADTIADNASSGAIVIGTWVPYTGDLDLPTMAATLHLNGIHVDSGLGSAVLGDPAAAVAWLANALAPFDTGLTAGEFVMSGSITTAAVLSPGDIATTTIGTLGTVSLHAG